MKKLKFTFMFLVITCLQFLLCSCWDQVEIDRLAVVKTLSISESAESNELSVSVDITNISNISSTLDTNSSKKAKENIITATGKTVSQALDNLESRSNKKLTFSHNKVLILSKGYAEKGITDILDTLERDHDFRNTTYIMVSDIPALEVMNAKINLEEKEMSGTELLLQLSSESSKIHPTEWYMFLQNLKSDTSVATIPLIRMNGASELLIDTTAIFKDNKMIGVLSTAQTKYFQWFLNNIKNQDIDVPMSDNNTESIISLNILRGKCNMKPSKSKNGIEMNITCYAVASIKGSTGSALQAEDYHVINKIKLRTEDYLKRNLENVIQFSQQPMKTDILGFGNKINNVMPVSWKNLKKNWEEDFSNIKYNVVVNIKINETGMIKNTIEKNMR